jgi:hypothetical protein
VAGEHFVCGSGCKPRRLPAQAPNLIDTAADEATHLMKSTDKNGDGILTYDEVVDEHELWVGSEATNFGDRLTDEL